LYGNQRPTAGSWTAGAVQLNGVASVPPTQPVPISSGPTGSISGKYFLDSNHDGIWNAGEAAAPYWWAYIDANNNGKYDSGERQVRADATATYTFTGLSAGSYVVRAMIADGWTCTSPLNGGAQAVNLASGQNFTGANFGEYRGTISVASAGPASISGTFFYDSNANGAWDSWESALPSWRVYIDANKDGQYDTGDIEVRCDANGKYVFSGLAAGTYVVRPAIASGFRQTTPSKVITVFAGQPYTGANFGEVVL
jgi:hypothetical protein